MITYTVKKIAALLFLVSALFLLTGFSSLPKAEKLCGLEYTCIIGLSFQVDTIEPFDELIDALKTDYELNIEYSLEQNDAIGGEGYCGGPCSSNIEIKTLLTVNGVNLVHKLIKKHYLIDQLQSSSVQVSEIGR